MIPISSWYDRLGRYTFPTVFIAINEAEKTALVADENDLPMKKNGEAAEAAGTVVEALQQAIRALPGSCFVGADVCSPTDSPFFPDSINAANGSRAWQILRSSEKVKEAFAENRTTRLTVRPYRNMNRIREFRLFIYKRRLAAMSQLNLQRHFARFAKRQEELWERGVKLANEVAAGLPCDNVVVDIYFCSNGDILLIDMNEWGGGTDPLLLRTWEQDWSREIGLKLIPPPVRMQGNISVSF